MKSYHKVTSHFLVEEVVNPFEKIPLQGFIWTNEQRKSYEESWDRENTDE